MPVGKRKSGAFQMSENECETFAFLLALIVPATPLRLPAAVGRYLDCLISSGFASVYFLFFSVCSSSSVFALVSLASSGSILVSLDSIGSVTICLGLSHTKNAGFQRQNEE